MDGCRYCGLPKHGSRVLGNQPHGQRWAADVRWHVWTQPTQDQIKERMQARRTWQGQTASLVIIDETANLPTTTERTDT